MSISFFFYTQLHYLFQLYYFLCDYLSRAIIFSRAAFLEFELLLILKKISKNKISKQISRHDFICCSKMIDNVTFIRSKKLVWVHGDAPESRNKVSNKMCLLRCDYVMRSNIFFCYSLFNATISDGQLSFKCDYLARV